MTTPLYARLVAQVLAAKAHEASPPSADDRDRAILAVAAALRSRRRRRAIRRSLLVVSSVAAVAAVVALVVRDRHGEAASSARVAAPPAAQVIAHPAGEGATIVSAANAPLVEGEALAPGSRIIARPGGRALLAFATGTQLTLEDGGDLTLVDGGPTSVVALGQGAVLAKVAKLKERERFLVRTDDAEVEVRGTSFRVGRIAPGECGGIATTVSVFEGVVVVRHGDGEEKVGAGQSWPASCEPLEGRAGASATPSRGRSAGGAKRPESTLAAQNDLFAAAVTAKEHGDTATAAARFADFVARYPASALAESAAAQRMKILRGSDPAQAASAARAYLARWPGGFARSDAEDIASGAR